jgi:hypothetical protein
VYTRGAYDTMPSDDTNLTTPFSGSDYTDVESDNEVFVCQSATGQYSEFLFKNRDLDSSSYVTLTWEGKASLAPSLYTVFLQAYNRTLTSWVTVDSNNLAGADSEFTMGGTLPIGGGYTLADFEDANGFIACRIYQGTV